MDFSLHGRILPASSLQARSDLMRIQVKQERKHEDHALQELQEEVQENQKQSDVLQRVQ
jgi:hypothetical protein